MTIALLGDPASIHLQRWLHSLAARGHRVHLLVEAGDGLDDGRWDDVIIHRFVSYGRRVRPRGFTVARAGLRREIAAIDPDILHAHYLTRFGWLGALAGRHPLVITVWGTDVLRTINESAGARLLGRWALRRADLVTGVTEQLVEAATRAGARASRGRVVQFGVDPEAFRPRADDGALRTRLGLVGRRVVFAPRWLRPIYRQAVMVDALERLPPDVALVLSRQGADANTLADIEDRAERAGTASRLRIVEGISHEDMSDYYRLADVVVSVPESDAFPVTALEAMACGTPLVLSDLPAAHEGLSGLPPEAREAARLVPVGDVDATVLAVQGLLGLSDEERRTVAPLLRQAALDRGDADRAVDRMEGLYVDLASGRDLRP